MIKHGVVQGEVVDLTFINQLPQLGKLPHWSRVPMLNRGGYAKSFKDKLQPVSDRNASTSKNDRSVNLSELNPVQRIQYLERSIVFLKQQHAEVLKSLHEEIDKLKTENKDLQFKIVMSQKQQLNGVGNMSASSRKSRAGEETKLLENEDKLEELKIIFLDEEIKVLKHALRESRNRNSYLSQVVEQSEDSKKNQQHTIDAMKYQLSHQGNAAHLAEHITSGVGIYGGRQLTLTQCEDVIRQLKQLAEGQKHELDGLKSDLRDVLYSHKWTPDAYLLAKAYVAEDDGKDGDGKDKSLKKFHMKVPTRKPTTMDIESQIIEPEVAYIQQDSVNLPALKQTISNTAVERNKRTQILQKSRLKKELM